MRGLCAKNGFGNDKRAFPIRGPYVSLPDWGVTSLARAHLHCCHYELAEIAVAHRRMAKGSYVIDQDYVNNPSL